MAALAYADDIVLLSPTVRAMRVLLNICDDFATTFDVVFNASKSKSKCIVLKPSIGRNMAIEWIPSINFCIGGK